MTFSAAGQSAAVAGAERPFRLAFTSSMFTEVNEDDARAAMKVWLLTVAGERGISLDPEPVICRNKEAILSALKNNWVDGVGLTLDVYWHLQKEVHLNRVVVGVANGDISEKYVLLVRRDGAINDIAGLRGKNMNILMNPRMSLAAAWLDTLLLENGFVAAAVFCNRITPANKPSQVILPVFFRQADAGLVTLENFETMGELNPQIIKQLSILETSPAVVPSAFAFRTQDASPVRDRMLVEMKRLHETPAGRQILSLLKTDRIDERPVSCLDSSMKLLAAYHGLLKAKPTAPSNANNQHAFSGKRTEED